MKKLEKLGKAGWNGRFERENQTYSALDLAE